MFFAVLFAGGGHWLTLAVAGWAIGTAVLWLLADRRNGIEAYANGSMTASAKA
ncbi:hypothetical protein ACNAW0_26450 [Micromonospora sp. SL1-18]|uniref:hypothetical protein n=1 Tax=Micromonospora sp. SL1-18 TaxID=3399128 RepID=UPI003A4DB683